MDDIHINGLESFILQQKERRQTFEKHESQ